MGIFDFFSPRKSDEEKLQRAAAESARRELQERPGFWRRLIRGRDPRFDRTLAEIAQRQRQQLYEARKQSRRLNEPREERQRERYEERLTRQLNIPGLEKRVAQYEGVGHPALDQAKNRLTYALRSRDEYMRRFDFGVKQRLEKEYYDYMCERRNVSPQLRKQGSELRESSLEQQHSAQLRQRAMYEQSNLARRHQPGRELGQGGFRRTNPGPPGSGQRPSYTQPGR